jgi:hypothetical protein
MNQAPQSITATVTPTRSLFSVGLLLVLVLAITAQLVTGFALMAQPGTALLVAHLIGGVVALVLTVAEWTWLGATRAGQYRLAGSIAANSGMAEWSEAAFLIIATITVLFGALLAAIMYLDLHLPFGALLATHRALAITVAVLYLAHSALALRRTQRQRTRAKMV